MRKHMFLSAAAVIVSGCFAIAGHTATAKHYTGTVTDTMCGANHGEGTDPAKCTVTCVKEHGAKYALYDTATKKVYVLDPQNTAVGHEGKTVTISGTLDADGKTLHVDSIKAKAAAKTT